jgi:archaellum component FlaC
MQSRIPVSKPLALVVIGIIIGLSLGLGSGYAVFYPDMVNQRSKTIEERVTDIEDNVSAMDSKITGINQSIGVITDSLDGILALTDVINQVSSRVSALENGQITLNNELKSLENELAQLETDFIAIESSWGDVTTDFADLETAYRAVNNELTSIQSLVKKNDGIRILTTYMANPPVTFEQKISVEVYNVLTQRELNFKNWVTLYGENTAKILLQQEINAIAGGLVWNPVENIPVGGNSYQIKLGTYFTMEFKPAGVTVNNMHLEIRATVNIDTGVVSTLQVSLVEVV